MRCDRTDAKGGPLAALELSLLGSPQALIDGQPLEVDTRKAIALLAYLAVTTAPQGRDTIAALLWPDYDQERARAALRRTLSTLKRSLPDDLLAATRSSIDLRRDGARVDVNEFRNLLARPRTHAHPDSGACPECVSFLSSAVAMYRGDFMAGFTLRDSVTFEDWQVSEAESLRRELDDALDKLTTAHAAAGELDDAVALAHRRLSLDPLNEAAHRDVMRLLAWKGQRPSALRHYRECVALLERELGVPPLEETTDLYTAITENREGARPLELPAAPLGRTPGLRGLSPRRETSTYPIVGRAQELEALMDAYGSIQDDGVLVVIEGEAGVGKTRLSEEFVASALGARSLGARCHDGESHLAYGLFVECLEELALKDSEWLEKTPQEWLGEAARLVPDFARFRQGVPAPPPFDSPGARSHFFEGVLEVLSSALEGGSPGVLLLEDLHWCDEASLDLVAYILRRLRGRPLCVVATWRSEEIEPAHRLRRWLAESSRDRAAVGIELSRLSESDVKEFLELIGEQRTIDPQLSEQLYVESEGLPLFVIEYLTSLDEHTDNDEPWPVPSGIRDLMRARLATAGQTAGQLLGAAAVIGRSFDFDTLQRASGRSQTEAVLAVEELLRRRLISETPRSTGDGDPAYDFSHDKLRRLVYEEMTPARRRLLHGRVADAMSQTARRDFGAVHGLVAEHYRLAGDENRAAEHFMLAGDHARSVYANRQALDYYMAALAHGHPRVATLHESIGDLHTVLGEYAAAITSYETAAALCEEGELGHLEHKIGGVHLRRGELELAESHLETALTGSGSTEGTGRRARVCADLSLVEHRKGEIGEARRLAEEALTLAENVDDDHALAQAHNIIGVLASNGGDFESAERHLKTSLALAENLDDPAARIAALNNLALVARANQGLERALQLTRTALELCARHGDRHREAALHNNLADLLHAVGSADEAMEHLKVAARIFAEIGEESGGMMPEVWKLVEW